MNLASLQEVVNEVGGEYHKVQGKASRLFRKLFPLPYADRMTLALCEELLLYALENPVDELGLSEDERLIHGKLIARAHELSRYIAPLLIS